MTDVVAEFRPRERAQLDHTHIVEIGYRLGPSRADDFICRTMEEIAVLLSEAQRAWEHGQFVRLRAAAVAIRKQAAGIGMRSLERASANMVECLERDQVGALPAVFRRMLRIGEQSFVAVWELGDVSL